MNRKILVALSVVLLAIVAMGTASAFEFPDLGSIFGGTPPDQNVTLDGETFHIPGTFKNNTNVSENGTVNDYTFFNSTTYSRGFQNSTNYINILIFDYKGATVTDVFVNYNNGTSKTINGTKGFMYSDNVGYTFSYAKGNKVISIHSDNENLIGPVIAK